MDDAGIALAHGSSNSIVLAGDDLTVRSDDISIRSDRSTTLQAGTTANVQAGTTATFDAAGNLSITTSSPAFSTPTASSTSRAASST